VEGQERARGCARAVVAAEGTQSRVPRKSLSGYSTMTTRARAAMAKMQREGKVNLAVMAVATVAATARAPTGKRPAVVQSSLRSPTKPLAKQQALTGLLLASLQYNGPSPGMFALQQHGSPSISTSAVAVGSACANGATLSSAGHHSCREPPSLAAPLDRAPR